MKYDYYSALISLSADIDSFCRNREAAGQTETDFRENAERWRELISGRLYEDFLPPIDRRDLLNLVKSLMAVTYAISFALSFEEIDSAAGILLCHGLTKCTRAVYEETCNIKPKSCCPTRIRKEALRLISKAKDCHKSGCNILFCQSFIGIAKAAIDYSDYMESAIIINN